MAHAVPSEAVQMEMQSHPSGVLLRTIVIGLTAFLTVVDLFATQAILPSLARAYQVTPAAMGFAVNSSTMGMAVAGLALSLFSQRINRRLGILISLSILSIPTALLAIAPDLTTFTAPLPPISQAMSRAISLAAWSRPQSLITWALPRIFTSLRCSISAVRCSSTIPWGNLPR
jgi:predicted MFS family arabinose efflux permease